MYKKLVCVLVLGLFFISGVLLGHYKPELFQIPFSYIKAVLVNEKNSVYQKSVYRLKNNFDKGTCVNKDQGYSFFVAGHVYGKPGVKYNGIYEPFKSNSKLNNCVFMPLGFLLGDTVVEASNYEFNILKNDIRSIGNNTNIFISPGNHDVGTGPYDAKRDIYIKHFGEETFKYFNYENDLFILLDANLNNWNIIGNQLQMLKNLNSGENIYNNVFIFSHQVIWIDADNKKFSGLLMNSEEGKAEKLNFWNEVFPVINDIGEKVFVFAGDVGAFDNESEFFYDNISGVNFFATGMGGGKRDNFLLIHINHGKVQIELIHLDF
jgi:hypothetical protein